MPPVQLLPPHWPQAATTPLFGVDVDEAAVVVRVVVRSVVWEIAVEVRIAVVVELVLILVVWETAVEVRTAVVVDVRAVVGLEPPAPHCELVSIY